MNGVWSFLKDGKPIGARFIGPAKALDANTPEGCTAVEGMVEFERPADPAMQRAKTLARIADLEAKQLRAMREHALRPNEMGPDGKSPRARLQTIDDEIASLRATINAGTDTSAP